MPIVTEQLLIQLSRRLAMASGSSLFKVWRWPHPSPQVRFPESISKTKFSSLAKLLENKAQGRSWAVKGVIRDAENCKCTLTWQAACKFNSATKWVEAALANESTSWKLVVLDSAPASSAGSAKKRGPSEAGLGPGPSSKLPSPSPVATSVQKANSPKDWLPLRAMELLCGTAVCPAAARASELDMGDKIGEGTFGLVRRASRKCSGEPVVVKTMKAKTDNTHRWEFMHEVVILSRLEHPNIVKVLDVVSLPSGFSLVMKDAGPSLHSSIKGTDGMQLQVVLPCLQQLLEGLRYLHESNLIHTDLKPRNLCWSNGKLTIIDLGGGVVSLPGYRSQRTEAEIKKDGLQYCTVNYRSVELLLGDGGFSTSSDLWSVGAIFGEMVKGRGLFDGDVALDVLNSIFQKLGRPDKDTLEVLQALPLWSKQFPDARSPTLEEEFSSCLGPALYQVLQGFLRMSRTDRISAKEAMVALATAAEEKQAAEKTQQAPLAAAGAGEDGGQQATKTNSMAAWTVDGQNLFEGQRGSSRIQVGSLDSEVLKWLQDGVQGIQDWSFKKEQSEPNFWCERGVKLEIIGHLDPSGKKRSGLSLNGVDASKPVWPRWAAFNSAFKKVNGQTLNMIQKKLRANLRKLDHPGKNGEQLLEDDISSWAFELAAQQVLKPTPRDDPHHYDGGCLLFAHGDHTRRTAGHQVHLPREARPHRLADVPGSRLPRLLVHPRALREPLGDS